MFVGVQHVNSTNGRLRFVLHIFSPSVLGMLLFEIEISHIFEGLVVLDLCISMSWKCFSCSRYWGRRWQYCPLCQEIEVRRSCVLQLSRTLGRPVFRIVAQFIGLMCPIKKPLGRQLNSPCRCAHCRCPENAVGMPWRILYALRKKRNRGTAVAARWVYILSRTIGQATDGAHNSLDGLLLAVDCSSGPATLFLQGLPHHWAGPSLDHMTNWIASFHWCMALFMQFTGQRPSLPCMVGISSLVFLCPDLLLK
jgi:hypothetical protein